MTDPKNTPFTHDPAQRVEAAAIKGGVLTVNLGTLDHPQTVAVIIRPDKMREVLGVLGIESPAHLTAQDAEHEVIQFPRIPDFDPARRRR